MFLVSGAERNLVGHVSETAYGLFACTLKVDFFKILNEVGEETLRGMRHGEGVSTYCGSFFERSFLVLLLICELCRDSTDCSLFSLVMVKFPVIRVSVCKLFGEIYVSVQRLSNFGQ